MAQIQLTQERKGEIALQLLKLQFSKKAILLNKEQFQSEIDDTLNDLNSANVSKEELSSLCEELVREAVDKMFNGIRIVRKN